MTADVRPKMGKGRFQWNGGGWLGAAVGGTAWMVVTAGFLAVNHEVVAAVPFGCFLITSVCAYSLWMRREQLDPFSSHVAFLAVLSIATPVAWFSTDKWASPETLAQMSWPSWYGWNVVMLLVVPGVMLWLYVSEYRANVRHGGSTKVTHPR